MNLACRLVLLSMPLTVAQLSHAHHSFAAEFDSQKSAAIEGTVTEFWFQNPHARIYIEVPDDAGQTTLWEVETMTPNYLRRMGWTPNTFRPGDTLRALGSLARDGSNRLSLEIITLPDGTTLSPFPSAEQREAFYEAGE